MSWGALVQTVSHLLANALAGLGTDSSGTQAQGRRAQLLWQEYKQEHPEIPVCPVCQHYCPGRAAWTSGCGRPTRPARRCSWIMPGRRADRNGSTGGCGRQILSPCWAQQHLRGSRLDAKSARGHGPYARSRSFKLSSHRSATIFGAPFPACRYEPDSTRPIARWPAITGSPSCPRSGKPAIRPKWRTAS